MYTTCIVVLLTVSCFLFVKITDYEETIQKTKVKTQKFIHLLDRLLPLTKTNFRERTFLLIHFIICFLVDLYVSFTTYWVGAIYSSEFNQGKTYTYGVMVGGLYLVIFTLVSNTKIIKIKHWTLRKTMHFVHKFAFLLLISGGLGFYFF